MDERERESDYRRPAPDEDALGGTDAGAAADATDRRGAEAAATKARSAGDELVGSAAPEPLPDTAEAQGQAVAEGDLPSRRGFIPEEPAPGVMREPGPEAET
jgi:hypothetical protein